MTQSTRDLITGEITLDYLVRRASEGWKVSAVEWVREAEQSDNVRRISGPVIGEDEASKLPYGLQFRGRRPSFGGELRRDRGSAAYPGADHQGEASQ